jgi:hypothetical protein
MVKYKFEITQKELDALIDILLANEKNTKKRKRGRIAFAVLAIITLLLAVRSYLHFRYAFAVFYVVLCIWCIFMATIGEKLEQKLVLKKIQSNADEKLKSGVREYCFDENGVTIDSETGYGVYKWDAIKRWGTYQDYIYLKRIDEGTILVDKKALSDSEADELQKLLNANVRMSKSN